MATRYPIALQGVRNITDGNIASYTQNIHDMLATNVAVYASPSPSLTSYQTVIDTYVTARAAAVGGGKSLTAAKNDARQDLDRLTVRLAVYVNATVKAAETDAVAARAMLELSGFYLSVDPTPTSAFPPPSIVTCQSMDSGSIYNLLLPVPRCTGYVAEYRTAAVGVTPAGPWQTVFSTARFFTITDLTSGVAYDIKHAAIGNIKLAKNFGDLLTIVVI